MQTIMHKILDLKIVLSSKQYNQQFFDICQTERASLKVSLLSCVCMGIVHISSEGKLFMLGGVCVCRYTYLYFTTLQQHSALQPSLSAFSLIICIVSWGKLLQVVPAAGLRLVKKTHKSYSVRQLYTVCMRHLFLTNCRLFLISRHWSYVKDVKLNPIYRTLFFVHR